MTETPNWKRFCRALSVSGLPECGLPQDHEGAHVFRYVPTDLLFDRCQVMLRELSEELRAVDECLARRPVLDDLPDRCTKISRAITTAAQSDVLRAELERCNAAGHKR